MGSAAEQDGRSFAADPIVKSGGPLPPAWQDQLTSCVVDENVGLPDTATVTFRDPNHELLTATGITIGSPLTVSIATVAGKTPEKLFAGEVTALELDFDSTGSFTVVRAMNKAHRLLRGRKVVAFNDMNADAIVRKVAKDAGLKAGKIQAKKITYTQLSQPNISDWDFLQNLAEEHGVTVRVDELGKLDFAPLAPAASAPAPTTSSSKSPFVLEYGSNLMALRAVLTSTDQVNTVEVRGWDVKTKRSVVATKPVTTSKTIVPGLTPKEATAKFGENTMVVTDTPYGTQAEATAVATSLAASMSSGLGEIEAVVEGDPKLRAGVPVALGNAGSKFSGKYTATAVHHVIEPGQGYRTTVLVSTTPDRSLAGLATGADGPDQGPRIPGVASALVTDIKEPANDQRGWVKLTFPWLDAKYVSDWARTVQLGGEGGGGVISPDVGDEVLVGFEQGCLDRPYVLGGLYNGKDKPSEHQKPLVDGAGKVARRSLVSRQGHRLELLDARDGPPGVRLASGNDRLEIRLDEKTNSIEIAVKDRTGRRTLRSMTLDDRGITLDVKDGTGRRTLSSMTLDDRGITLDATTGDISLKGKNITVEAKTSASLSGKVSADVDGGATASLRAPMVRIN